MEHLVPSFNANAPFSAAVVIADELIFLSGQISMDLQTGKYLEGSVSTETKQALSNIETVLKSLDAGLNNVCECTCFLVDMSGYAEFNSTYAEFFTAGKMPARTTIAVSALPMGAKVEIKAIATKSS